MCNCYYKKYYCKCKKNVYERVKCEKNLSTLKSAIDSEPAIKTALETADPVTLFAPTNKAFEKFEGCGELSLAEILSYHAVPQYLPSCKLENDKLYDTLLPETKVRVNVYQRPIFKNVITVNGAKVKEADLKAKNGVVHKIKKVLCPPSKNILELALETPELSTLVVAVQAASPAIADALANADPLTVFAPTNEAFEKLDKSLQKCGSSLAELLQNQALLDQVLLYHVLGQSVFSAALKKGLTWGIETLQGKTLDIKRKCEDIEIIDQLHKKSKVVTADILATNGVVHLIDRVLLPKCPL